VAHRRGRPPSVFFTLYRLFLRTQVSRARVGSLLLLGGVGIVVGWTLGLPRVRNHLAAGTEFANTFGLSLFVPIVALVFASSMFGDLRDDGTLVYLWLRPLSRVKLAVAAAAASFTIAWPLAVPPLVAGTYLTNGGTDLVLGSLAAASLVLVAYVGAFCALGLRVKRPLVWGLLYIFIWEGFVARGSFTAAKIAVRAYGSSLLSRITGADLILSDIDLLWAITVPLAVGAAGLAYTVWRLHRQDVA
jgi:ABC-2 type transport system permease protein